jgi:hypothetical protein
MDTKQKEQVALFRFALIFPLLDDRLQRGELTRKMLQLCEREYEIPYSNRKRVSMGTLYAWLTAYRKQRNIEDLYPKGRSDKGRRRRISSETSAALLTLREQYPEDKITTLVRRAVNLGIFLPSEKVDMSLIYRIFREQSAKGPIKHDKDMRRLEMEYVNQMWYLDAMVGPKVYAGEGRQRLVTAKLFALLDDKSRLVPYGRFYRDETSESLLDCLWGAFNARGLPRQVHTDFTEELVSPNPFGSRCTI